MLRLKLFSLINWSCFYMVFRYQYKNNILNILIPVLYRTLRCIITHTVYPLGNPIIFLFLYLQQIINDLKVTGVCLYSLKSFSRWY